MDKQSENNGFFGSKFENFQYRPKADLWDRIQENINTHEAKGPLSVQFENFIYYPHKRVWRAIVAELFPQRKKNTLYWSYSAAASIILLVGTYFFFQNYEINKINPENYSIENIIANNQDQNVKPPSKNTDVVYQNKNNENNENVTFLVDTNINLSYNTIIGLKENFANSSSELMYSNVELVERESFFDKLKPLNALLISENNQISFLDKIEFLNIPFKQNYRSNSIDLKGQLASNLSLLSSQNDYEKNLAEVSTYSSFDLNANDIASKERESYYENKNHKPPFILGIIFNYQLSKRLSLSSGLNYIRLSTLASNEGSDWKSEYLTIKHYIGLPVNVNYDFVQQRKFNLFITSGVQYEKGIIDKNRTTEFRNGEQSNEYFSSDAIQGGQAGFNFGFGTNYHISKNFDIYLQTGITHYFYKSHYNIWSDKAIWPSFQTGIRFHL